MFKKLSEQEVNSLINEGNVGYYGEVGAVFPDDCSQVIVECTDGNYLVPKSEFQWSGVLVRLSDSALKVITPL